MSALNKVSYQIIAYEDAIQETPNKKKPNPYQTLLGVQYRLGLVSQREDVPPLMFRRETASHEPRTRLSQARG